MYSFPSLSVLWLITQNIFTNIEQQVSRLVEIINLFNEIKESYFLWRFLNRYEYFIWKGVLVEHLYKCEKNEYIRNGALPYYPHGTSVYLDLPFCFVEELLRVLECRKLMLRRDMECWIGSRLSGESREFGSDFTSRLDDDDAAEVTPKLLELSVFCSLLLFEVRPVWKRIFSSISSNSNRHLPGEGELDSDAWESFLLFSALSNRTLNSSKLNWPSLLESNWNRKDFL